MLNISQEYQKRFKVAKLELKPNGWLNVSNH